MQIINSYALGHGDELNSVSGRYDQTRVHERELERELTRQREQISIKLQALLDLRMDGEITADEYARKRQ